LENPKSGNDLGKSRKEFEKRIKTYEKVGEHVREKYEKILKRMKAYEKVRKA